MYEQFYGLKERPFSLSPDPKFFYLSEGHREAIEHLHYALIQKEGFVLLTGDIGTGKTTICRVLLEKYQKEYKVAFVVNPMLSEEELLKYIVQDFGIISSGHTKKELIDDLNKFLLEQLTLGISCILIIDEAQNLPLELLEQIRILSNLETEKEKLLQIILIGQAELNIKLSQLEQLNQRISVRYYLKPLKYKEVTSYIYHRLTVAGASGGITFTKGAMKQIFKFSKGIPRLINLICDRALLAGYTSKTTRITKALVNRAAKSLGKEGEIIYASPTFFKRKIVMALAMASFLLGVALSFTFHDWLSEMIPYRLYKVNTTKSNVLESKDTVPIKKIAESKSETNSNKKETLHQNDISIKKPETKPKMTYFYSINVEAYQSKEEAIARAQAIKKAGYETFITKVKIPKVGIWYRVLIGKFENKKDALKEEKKLKKEFPEAWTIRVQIEKEGYELNR